MSTNLPGTLDDTTSMPDPAGGTQPLGSGTKFHRAMTIDIRDGLLALEAMVGIASSSVTSSLDYAVKSTTGGHRHSGSANDGRVVRYTDLSTRSHGSTDHTGNIFPAGQDHIVGAGSEQYAGRTAASVSTPPAGSRTIFVNSADGTLTVKKSDASTTSLEISSGIAGVIIQEEGSTVGGLATTFNFIGAAVTASESGVVATVTSKEFLRQVFTNQGACVVFTGTLPLLFEKTFIINGLYLVAGTGPVGANLVANIAFDTVNQYSGSARPKILDGGVSGSKTGLSLVWTAGVKLTWNIETVGSTTPGSDLSFTIVGVEQ